MDIAVQIYGVKVKINSPVKYRYLKSTETNYLYFVTSQICYCCFVLSTTVVRRKQQNGQKKSLFSITSV